MSGDVQPRKRKDKKKTKRESLDRRSDGDIFARKSSLQDEEDVKEHHHGVHATKMGKEDLHLHVQSDHDTGGHWCAKLLFFSLLAIMFGLIGLIILENRGSSDLDTPLSESRFSEYFDGWVDEHRPSHDDHHEPDTGIDDHDGEPFDEEEDHSEQDDEDTTEVLEGHDDEDEEDDGDDEQDVNASNNDEDEVEGKSEDDEGEKDENDDDNEDEIVKDTNSRSKREVQEEDDDNDDEKDEGFEEDLTEDDDAGNESNQRDEDADEENDNDDEAPFEENSTNKVTTRATEDITTKSEVPTDNHDRSDKLHKISVGDQGKNDKRDVADPLQADTTAVLDDDFDDADESLEQVVDNDAGEELHLRRKAEEEELAAKAAKRVDEEGESAPPVPRKSDEPFQGPAEARRRFTMIAPDDDIPVEDEELLDEEVGEDYIDDAEGDEEDEEPELQYSEESEEDEEHLDETEENARITKFIPETFEQLNAMYRPKAPQPPVVESVVRNPAETVITKSLDPKPTVPPRRSPAKHQDENKPTVLEPVFQAKAAQFAAESFPRDRSPRMYNDQNEPFDNKVMDVDEEVGDEEEYDDEEIYSGSDEDVEDEEDISDVDDDDLLQRLEAKYGKLPERKYESDDDELDEESWTKVRGPRSYVDDDYLDEEIRRANDELFHDNLKPALQIFESLILKYPENPQALYGKAKVLDRLSTKYQNNQILLDTIEAYRAVVNLDKKADDEMFKEAAERCVDRMRFKGMLAEAVPIHRKLIKRFDNDPEPRNQLAVTYLLQNRYAEAKYILHHTLMRWRENGFAQVHYGFILKVHDNDMKSAAALLEEGLNSGANGTQDGRFYFALGDAFYRLGRKEDAKQVYKKGADLGLFPSIYQRSLYNVKGLKARPFWTREQTTYESFFAIMQLNWELIRKEGMAALNSQGYYVDEAESLRESGDWKQLELFARGYRIEKNCAKAPVTCNIIETFPAARTCKRGQVKFSIIHPGTHVWPHCGPTNCRLRAHLGLVVPPGAKLRVAEEERTWKAGEWLIFDDSFEHEVWHNGTSPRLVLIVDVWHPELTENQRDSLSRI